jgi:hypothetical protein
MLNFAAVAGIHLELIFDEKNEDFQHMLAIRLLEDAQDNFINRFGNFVLVFNVILVQIDEKIHENSSQVF